jgi:hypothetical protein
LAEGVKVLEAPPIVVVCVIATVANAVEDIPQIARITISFVIGFFMIKSPF